MTVPTLKILECCGWQPLWEALEKGPHEFTHDCVTKATETDLGAKIVMASRFIQ